MIKAKFDICSPFDSNAFTAMAEELSNAGLTTTDVVSITYLGARDDNGWDDFEVVFTSERAARAAVASYSCEDADSDFVTSFLQAA